MDVCEYGLVGKELVNVAVCLCFREMKSRATIAQLQFVFPQDEISRYGCSAIFQIAQ